MEGEKKQLGIDFNRDGVVDYTENFWSLGIVGAVLATVAYLS